MLLIGQGQTEGRAVSLLLSSSDRLTPQHPLGCPILCIYCCSCRAAKRKDRADRWPNYREEPTTVCQRIYMPINAGVSQVRSLAYYRSLKLHKITLKKWWNTDSESVTRVASVRNRFFCLFFILFLPRLLPPPISYLALTFPSLFSLRRCCHANFPGDGVVMDTERQGRSADVWCHSGMCTNRPPVCALFPSLLCSEAYLWSFRLPISSYLSTKHKLELQCDHIYFIYTLSSIVYMQMCSAWCFSWPVDSNNSKPWTQEVPAYALP